jgi:hypothetical protein
MYFAETKHLVKKCYMTNEILHIGVCPGLKTEDELSNKYSRVNKEVSNFLHSHQANTLLHEACSKELC